MAVRTITTRLAVDGEQEYKKQLSEVNSNLRTLKSEMQLTTEQFKGQANSVEALTAKDKLLRDEIAQQKVKVESLERAVADAAEAYGDADSRTDKYRQALNRAKTDLIKLDNELNDNDRYLAEAKNSANGAATSIDKFGKEAKGASNDVDSGNSSLSNMIGSLGDLKGALMGGAIVSGLQSVAGAITNIVESSSEYRKVMGTLETSSQQAGYTAEQTTEVYSRLQAVLGDTQTAATTTANLQAIGLSQEDLIDVTNAAIGAWATYGDSIPIDGLAESINETIQAGTVTGTFADALNWAGVSEDDFNEKLAACQDESARAQAVLEQLRDQGLIKASDAWFELNEDIVSTNEAQAKYDEALGELGEALSPAAANIKNFATDALGVLLTAVNKGTSAWKRLKQAMQDIGIWDTSTRASTDMWDIPTPDGYNAGGLDRVPYDGYLSYLHKDEAVLTSSEAQVWRSLQSAAAPQKSSGVTGEEYRSGLAQAVTALSAVQGAASTQPANITLVTKDGRELARGFLSDLRAAARESPEVSDD